MGTTEIPTHRTIAEVQGVLVKSGAKQIAQDYGEGGLITGMKFSIVIEGGKFVHFDLPVRCDKVYTLIHDARKNKPEKYEQEDRKTAERIAWRQLLRWIEAQMALVDLGMVKAHEVFMPYALDQNGRTMFSLWNQRLALPAPKEK